MMDTESRESLRVLVANERKERVNQVIGTVTGLGHEVVQRRATLEDVPVATLAERPDVALVILDENSGRTLELIGRIVRESACPVIAILDVQDRAFIKEAAKRGIFAYITHGEDPEELQSSIDIALQRFAEYHNLEGAFGRRAVTERAKGILMERHFVDEQAAFNLLRDQARRSNRKIVDVAEALIVSHRLLSATSRPPRPHAAEDPKT